MKGPGRDRLRSQGGLNISPHWRAWSQELHAVDTQYWREWNANDFPHQALSTLCPDVFDRCDSVWMEGLQSSRFPSQGNRV